MKKSLILFLAALAPLCAWADEQPAAAAAEVKPDITTIVEVPGDVNKDGKVDIDDIVLIINHYLADEATQAEATAYFRLAANINQDKKIDIDDIVAAINIYLGK